ncbi:MAG: cysteine desulfurase NifS [Eubacteriales bacterium]
MNRIYLDHAATTYIKPEVLEAMMPYFSENFGNGSSIYKEGREAKKALESARKTVAQSLGAKPTEVFFTSGGSESDNWAIKGAAFANIDKGKHIITTKIEHHAVLEACHYLEKFGFEITELGVDKYGVIDLEELQDAIREDTVLVSIMYANNEIGTIQPIEKAADIAHAKGVLFHTDAVQAVGQIPIDLSQSNIDLLSISGHKLYAPNGVGALYIKEGVVIDSLIHGGAQERNRRAGTENIAGIVGLAKAFELVKANMDEENKRLTGLRDKLIDSVLSEIPESMLNGSYENRLPNNVNFSFKNVDGEAILINLDLMGFSCSTGSACTSACTGPSYVLKALGMEFRWINGSARLTLGERTTEKDIDDVVTALKETMNRLRMITLKV